MWWQAVVGGFAGGSLGAIVGALLQLRNSRLEQLRQQQLTATSEFAAVAVDVFVTLGANMETIGSPDARDPHEWLAAIKTVEEEALARTHDLTRLGPRLELLFGKASTVSISGLRLLGALIEMTREVRKDPPDVALVTNQYVRAADALTAFNSAAHLSITMPLWRLHLARVFRGQRKRVSEPIEDPVA